eukprot:2213081-Amphidinium_carterae.1
MLGDAAGKPSQIRQCGRHSLRTSHASRYIRGTWDMVALLLFVMARSIHAMLNRNLGFFAASFVVTLRSHLRPPTASHCWKTPRLGHCFGA